MKKVVRRISLSISLWFGFFIEWLRDKWEAIRKEIFPDKYIKIDIPLKEREFGMSGGSEFIDPLSKSKIDNVSHDIRTFYLKHKKSGRTIVVKGSYIDTLNKYGKEFDFQKPMIEDVGDEWDELGHLVKDKDFRDMDY